MGEVLLSGGLRLAVLALSLGELVHWKRGDNSKMKNAYLVSGAASQASNSTLNCARGLVEVALSRGSLVLVGRHGCDCCRFGRVQELEERARKFVMKYGLHKL